MKSDALIGIASRNITPEPGCQMAGFAARKGPAVGVHDDLYARAMVIDDGSTTAALVTTDLLGIHTSLADEVRKRIEERTSIPAGHVALAATHTHCGPTTFNHFYNQGQPLDGAYLERLAGLIVASVEDAHGTRKQRRIRTGFVPVEGVAVNRRSADGQPIDPTAGVIAVDEMDGSPAAIVINYACHPTVLGPNTREISGDFPAYTVAELKRRLGSGVEVLYFNGAEGDLSVGHRSDLSAVGVIAPFRTFAKAEELGGRLGEAVAAGMASLEYEDATLRVRSSKVLLPLKQYAPLGEMTARRERLEDALRAMNDSTPVGATPTQEILIARQQSLFAQIDEYYALLYEREAGEDPKSLEAEVLCVGIGDTALICFPGEVFVEIALDIRARSQARRTMFIGLANGYIGYVPTATAETTAGYEVVAARVTRDAAEALTLASERLVNTRG
jgi:hypothetical protein